MIVAPKSMLSSMMRVERAPSHRTVEIVSLDPCEGLYS